MVVGTAKEDNVLRCPECGSTSLMKFGKKFAKREGKRIRVQQYQCQDCGRISIKPIIGGSK